MSEPTTPVELEHLLKTALAYQEQGDMTQADQAFRNVLEADPSNIQALNYLGERAFGAGDFEDSLQLLHRALPPAPKNPLTLRNLGSTYLAMGRIEDARLYFGRVLDVAPGSFIVRLQLANIYEQSGDSHAALVDYFAAINQAQRKGRWLNNETTMPSLRPLVKHAMAFIDAGRRDLFGKVLAPFVEKYGEEAMRRTMKCLQIYLGETAANYPDARQKPLFLYFPDLPTSPYLDTALFPWIADLERNTDVIRSEMLQVLSDEKGIEPFLKFRSEAEVPKFLGGGNGKPAWDAFFFYRHGKRYNENCERCPQTAAILEALPLVYIRDHGPEICFSVLTPGTHILPHHGVTNARVVTHLPLIVPENCALSVGGEIHEWKEGRCVSFDDTFEHEAWNRSDKTRVVVILDCWNPHLTAAEREVVTELIVAIGDFNRECGISSE